MGVDASSLNDIVRKLGDAVASDCTLVAAGGTALTLHGLKSSTEDVDFVVEYGDKGAVESVAASIGGPRIDLFSAGSVFNNPLPADYMSRVEYKGEFGHVTLMAMAPLDVVMTKIARADGGDMEDIRSCAGRCTPNDIIGAARAYGVDTPELRNNLRRVLHEVYGVEFGTAEEDLR